MKKILILWSTLLFAGCGGPNLDRQSHFFVRNESEQDVLVSLNTNQMLSGAGSVFCDSSELKYVVETKCTKEIELMELDGPSPTEWFKTITFQSLEGDTLLYVSEVVDSMWSFERNGGILNWIYIFNDNEY